MRILLLLIINLIFSFTLFAFKNNDQPLWQKILESKSILRVTVNSVYENKCSLTVNKSILGGRDSGDTFLMKYSKTHAHYLGRNWIAKNSEYIIFLKKTIKRKSLSSIFDKMKIISDSVLISSRTLNDLPSHPEVNFDLFPKTDAGNSIGYKVPLLEFDEILRYITENFKLNCFGTIKKIKEQKPIPILNRSVLFNLLIDKINRVRRE